MPFGLKFDHGEKVFDGLRIDIVDNPVEDVSLTTTVAYSDALDEGLYDIWATGDCFIATGSAAQLADLTAANGRPLAGGSGHADKEKLPCVLVEEGDRIGGIMASGTATLSYQKVG